MITIDTAEHSRKKYNLIITDILKKGLKPLIDYTVFVPISEYDRYVYHIHFNTPEALVFETILILKHL